MADLKLLQSIESEIAKEITRAVDFALAAPYPNADEVDQHVYA
jgi:TPP-dependent pyruvate/acetoin dehydrogenase alpha subunit